MREVTVQAPARAAEKGASSRGCRWPHPPPIATMTPSKALFTLDVRVSICAGALRVSLNKRGPGWRVARSRRPVTRACLDLSAASGSPKDGQSKKSLAPPVVLAQRPQDAQQEEASPPQAQLSAARGPLPPLAKIGRVESIGGRPGKGSVQTTPVQPRRCTPAKLTSTASRASR